MLLLKIQSFHRFAFKPPDKAGNGIGHRMNLNDHIDMEKVTIKDIAAAAGVSTSLVSCVMNNHFLENGKERYRVSAKTKEKILNIAKEMNYEPNMAARVLRGGNSHVIGAILADISNVYYGSIAKYLEDLLFGMGYTLLVANTDEEPEKFSAAVTSFIAKGVDGIVAFPCEGSLTSVRKIEESGIPLVVMCRFNKEVNAPSILIDGVSAIRKAVELLHSKGIEDICMLSYTMRVSSILEREEGFIKGIYGNYSDRTYSDRILRMNFATLEKEVEQFVADGMGGVKGVVTATNALAVSLIKSMMKHGIRVQEDVFVVGFDEDNAYTIFEPEIPHIVQPAKEMCNIAVKELLAIIEKKEPQAQKKIIVQCIMES